MTIIKRISELEQSKLQLGATQEHKLIAECPPNGAEAEISSMKGNQSRSDFCGWIFHHNKCWLNVPLLARIAWKYLRLQWANYLLEDDRNEEIWKWAVGKFSFANELVINYFTMEDCPNASDKWRNKVVLENAIIREVNGEASLDVWRVQSLKNCSWS